MTEIILSGETIEAILKTLNTAVFLIYGMDKFSAKIHGKRVPEKILLLLAVAGGGFGALGGMIFFRHKTKRWKFRIIVSLSALLQLIAYWIFFPGR